MQGLLNAAKVGAGAAGAAAGKSLAASAAGSRGAAQLLRPQAPAFSPVLPAAAAPPPRSVAAAAAATLEAPAAPAGAPADRAPAPRRPARRAAQSFPLQFKYLVPAAVLQLMLADGGAAVDAVLAETGVLVHFSREGAGTPAPSERLMTLHADAADAAKAALARVLDVVAGAGGGGRLRRRGGAAGEAPRLALRQVIPPASAGKVLGPGGDTCKALSASTGCSVVVQSKPARAAFTPFRIVSVLGDDAAAVAAAAGAVVDLLVEDDRYAAGIREVQSVALRVIAVPDRRCGRILGPGGANIKALQDVLGVKLGISEADGDVRHVTVWGQPLAVRVAVDVVRLAGGTLAEAARGADDDAASVASLAA